MADRFAGRDCPGSIGSSRNFVGDSALQMGRKTIPHLRKRFEMRLKVNRIISGINKDMPARISVFPSLPARLPTLC